MENTGFQRYHLLPNKYVLKEAKLNTVSEWNEISQYEVDFDHDWLFDWF